MAARWVADYTRTEAILWVEGGRGLAYRGILTRFSRPRPAVPPEPQAVVPPVTVWQALRRAGGLTRSALWQSFARHQAVFWGALAITLVASAAAAILQRPPAMAQLRLTADPPDAKMLAEARAELEGAGARLAALDTLGRSRVLPELGAAAAGEDAIGNLADLLTVVPSADHALLVRMRHRDAAVAADYLRALAAAVVARTAPPARPPQATVTSLPGPPEVLAGLRARVAADLAASDRRAAVLSDGLTDTAHDMVSALRANALPTVGPDGDTRPLPADVLDQGRVLMAELQLRRLQLASKYQDDFPAVTALDGEIDRLRNFLAGEQKRGTAARSLADRNLGANPVLETLGAERRRLGAELDEENARRTALRRQLATLDGQIAAAPTPTPTPAPGPVPVLVAGAVVMLPVPDPRLLSVPAILLVGGFGAVLLQWVMLRGRTTIATAAEAEIILGLPVLRCLDVDGHPIPQPPRRAGAALSADADRRSG